ncbi:MULTISPECIES: class I SAM-dependent methyltransferase [unclassified Pseudodesulfovibrio]|uniref:class I SAM-dependent methyltransferase n=1 Tax=unclassified Pseudodesulfovibrio TaxID=2661612 RepID=UPI000FEBEAB9|nr:MULTISPECIES: class I SAM-dependent methyltransferase [unclassified Pseudodesulfovibrio]MCJ2163383.1 class I SAM-dependent methyltransferase [Pseudodesulfovibrio sp. S3-i]RWU06621.1 class I SAM-dependent methyltransferase [Pseudodesulfovibrio sp. S3]
MQKINTEGISDAVADTLFITLYMRCLETRRPDRIIKDQAACNIVESVDYDFSKYDDAIRSQVGICIRVQYFDEIARRFLDNNASPVVINLGCGLDTRSTRIGLNKGTFYNIDLPEVMELRDKLLPPDEHNISIHKSMFDPSWTQEIREKHPQANILIMAEGVFMFFPEDEIRPVLEQVARSLSPGELVFDACTAFGCRMSSRHDTLKHTNASFQWALNDDTLPERWASNLHLQNVAYYMDKEKKRWDNLSRFMSMFPILSKAFKMLHFQMTPAQA